MPRFFFHLRGDGQNFEDAIGSEFETVQHAEMAALRHTIYAAGLHVAATSPEAAKALVQHLKASEAAPAIKKMGIEPG